MSEALIEAKEIRGNRIWRWQLERQGIDPDKPWRFEDRSDIEPGAIGIVQDGDN